jgi:putative oxidoreductase
MSDKLTITLDLFKIGRVFLALVLIWAALSKLANPTEFLGALYAYQLPLPKPLLQLAAVALPWFEFLCGFLLLANVWTESALVALAGLLVIFLLTTGQAWARGLHISCGCFNLPMLGLTRGHPLVELIDSAGFAFIRNLAFSWITWLLLRKQLIECRPVQALSQVVAKPMPKRGAA